jgi:NTP pyrophosphatase (non-canonical NTP hydrolase)
MTHKLMDDELWQRMYDLHVRSTGGNLSGENYYNVRFLSLALCGEAGELANIIKKQWRGLSADGGIGAQWSEARDEIADIVVYSMLIFSALGGDPQHPDGLRKTIMAKLDKFEAKLNASGIAA